jgi:branched-subunit amino acid transport protein
VVQKEFILIIAAMAFVTYLPRFLPALLLSSRPMLPQKLIIWLGYVPIAVIAALVMPSIVLHDNRVDLSFSNIFLWAALPTILMARLTRNLFITVIFGMGVVATARILFN